MSHTKFMSIAGEISDPGAVVSLTDAIRADEASCYDEDWPLSTVKDVTEYLAALDAGARSGAEGSFRIELYVVRLEDRGEDMGALRSFCRESGLDYHFVSSPDLLNDPSGHRAVYAPSLGIEEEIVFTGPANTVAADRVVSMLKAGEVQAVVDMLELATRTEDKIQCALVADPEVLVEAVEMGQRRLAGNGPRF